MFKYETHLHTFPVSKCAKAEVRDVVEYYKILGYDGIFITNHFIDGSLAADCSMSYEEKIEFYFSDYEKGLEYGKKIGLKVFCGVEMSYKGTDFLVYGLNKKWFLNNHQIMNMKKSEELQFLMDSGALVIQAHPYREATYIDHIRLFPRKVHGVEVMNACRTQFENNMAKSYAENYRLIEFAGSDNHTGSLMKTLCGMCSKEPVVDEFDFINRVKNGKMCIFTLDEL